MDKLYHSPLFEYIREYFLESDPNETIFLFAPYIKTKVLKKLLDNISNKIIIITTWRPKDIQFGSSEVELYPFCKERNITLYVSDNMHLKVYSKGLNSAILATGNVSHRGLLPGGNYEAGTMIERLTNEDRLFFEKIRLETRLVDDEMYEMVKKWNLDNKVELSEQLKLDDIAPLPIENHFLISALPMTRKIDDLVLGYQRITKGEEPSDDAEITSCIFHDLANYKILLGLSKEKFLEELSSHFFEHPFIRKIDEFISLEAYFGRIKEWIQGNCTTVPVPSRRELTGNVQVLLEWFAELGDGKYVIDVPGARSQRIRKVS